MIETCLICGRPITCDNIERYDDSICCECDSKYPDYLLKAVIDVWHGYIGLRNGQILYWEGSLRIKSDWVYLPQAELFDEQNKQAINELKWSAEDRGVWVRISDISWIIDGAS